MQYTLSIDQVKSIEWGLNVSQALLFDFLTKTALWAETRHIEGETYYHVRRNKVASELPLVSTSSATFKRHLIALEEKELIERRVVNGKPFVRITGKGSGWNNPVQNCTPGANLHRDPVQNCTHPGANLHTDQYTNDQDTKDQGEGSARKAAKPKLSVADLATDYGIPEDLAAQFMAIRRDKKLTPTPTAIDRLITEFEKAGLSTVEGIRLCCEKSWAGFKASWRWKDEEKPHGTSSERSRGGGRGRSAADRSRDGIERFLRQQRATGG